MHRLISHPLAIERLRDAQRPDGAVDELAAAIAIATHLTPTISPAAIVATLDQFAADARAMLDKGNALAGVINHVLFDRHGFAGNRRKYQDPQNSYIHRVLERRTGLPILLSLIYVQTARRAGGQAWGIGLPGHFIVGVDNHDGRVLIDAFNCGVHLTHDDCRHIATASGAVWSDDALEPVDGRRWALRMLANLQIVYAGMGDAANTTAVVEQMLLLEPDSCNRQQELKRLYACLDEQAARNN